MDSFNNNSDADILARIKAREKGIGLDGDPSYNPGGENDTGYVQDAWEGVQAGGDDLAASAWSGLANAQQALGYEDSSRYSQKRAQNNIKAAEAHATKTAVGDIARMGVGMAPMAVAGVAAEVLSGGLATPAIVGAVGAMQGYGDTSAAQIASGNKLDNTQALEGAAVQAVANEVGGGLNKVLPKGLIGRAVGRTVDGAIQGGVNNAVIQNASGNDMTDGMLESMAAGAAMTHGVHGAHKTLGLPFNKRGVQASEELKKKKSREGSSGYADNHYDEVISHKNLEGNIYDNLHSDSDPFEVEKHIARKNQILDNNRSHVSTHNGDKLLGQVGLTLSPASDNAKVYDNFDQANNNGGRRVGDITGVSPEESSRYSEALEYAKPVTGSERGDSSLTTKEKRNAEVSKKAHDVFNHVENNLIDNNSNKIKDRVFELENLASEAEREGRYTDAQAARSDIAKLNKLDHILTNRASDHLKKIKGGHSKPSQESSVSLSNEATRLAQETGMHKTLTSADGSSGLDLHGSLLDAHNLVNRLDAEHPNWRQATDKTRSEKIAGNFDNSSLVFTPMTGGLSLAKPLMDKLFAKRAQKAAAKAIAKKAETHKLAQNVYKKALSSGNTEGASSAAVKNLKEHGIPVEESPDDVVLSNAIDGQAEQRSEALIPNAPEETLLPETGGNKISNLFGKLRNQGFNISEINRHPEMINALHEGVNENHTNVVQKLLGQGLSKDEVENHSEFKKSLNSLNAAEASKEASKRDPEIIPKKPKHPTKAREEVKVEEEPKKSDSTKMNTPGKAAKARDQKVKEDAQEAAKSEDRVNLEKEQEAFEKEKADREKSKIVLPPRKSSNSETLKPDTVLGTNSQKVHKSNMESASLIHNVTPEYAQSVFNDFVSKNNREPKVTELNAAIKKQKTADEKRAGELAAQEAEVALAESLNKTVEEMKKPGVSEEEAKAKAEESHNKVLDGFESYAKSLDLPEGILQEILNSKGLGDLSNANLKGSVRSVNKALYDKSQELIKAAAEKEQARITELKSDIERSTKSLTEEEVSKKAKSVNSLESLNKTLSNDFSVHKDSSGDNKKSLNRALEDMISKKESYFDKYGDIYTPGIPPSSKFSGETRSLIERLEKLDEDQRSQAKDKADQLVAKKASLRESAKKHVKLEESQKQATKVAKEKADAEEAIDKQRYDVSNKIKEKSYDHVEDSDKQEALDFVYFSAEEPYARTADALKEVDERLTKLSKQRQEALALSNKSKAELDKLSESGKESYANKLLSQVESLTGMHETREVEIKALLNQIKNLTSGASKNTPSDLNGLKQLGIEMEKVRKASKERPDDPNSWATVNAVQRMREAYRGDTSSAFIGNLKKRLLMYINSLKPSHLPDVKDITSYDRAPEGTVVRVKKVSGKKNNSNKGRRSLPKHK